MHWCRSRAGLPERAGVCADAILDLTLVLENDAPLMKYRDFENLSRLFVVGSLDEDERCVFEAARRKFGEEAEKLIRDQQKVAAVFAMRLKPHPPHPETKARVMAAIRGALERD